MCHKIKEGAVFISDAHDNSQQDGFYRFLMKIESKQIEATQLFLMGDMFDLLVGEVAYLKEIYKKEITLLEKIAQSIEVFYFEGNHDFSLKKIFKNIKIIDIDAQPTIFEVSNKKILLLHGDKYGGFKHKLFTHVIRSSFLLGVLNFFDKLCYFCISKKILDGLKRKDICAKIDNFKDMIELKLLRYPTSNIDIVAEGHYHQDVTFDIDYIKYINFSSFACNQSYFIVQLSPDIKFIPIHLS